MEKPALALEAVAKSYGREKAVDGVTLDLAPGERLALLGHNGAGKTTLLKLALGLTRADGGALRTLGCTPGGPGWTEAKRAIGFLPESVAFLGSMTGRETIRFYGRLKGVGRAACEEALAHVGLAGAAGKRVKAYSKGMRQRLGFAQAILGTPRLLILDEPTGGLDPDSRHAFHATLGELAGRGTAIILSSHVLTEVEAGTDRVAIMRQGRLAACGTADELKREAGLAVTIRVTVCPGGGARLASALGGNLATRINDHGIEFRCSAGEKRALIKRILGAGDEIEDIEIVPPGLEAVYARFGGAERESAP